MRDDRQRERAGRVKRLQRWAIPPESPDPVLVKSGRGGAAGQECSDGLPRAAAVAAGREGQQVGDPGADSPDPRCASWAGHRGDGEQDGTVDQRGQSAFPMPQHAYNQTITRFPV